MNKLDKIAIKSVRVNLESCVSHMDKTDEKIKQLIKLVKNTTEGINKK